ncbi:MAG TPA: NYN domain-containing protein [Gaiellaceae bacterium]
MSDVLYLFDGYNLLHAGGFGDPQELVDRLAGFVALRGARGVVVFDGEGADASFGPLDVRFAPQADHLLERLAAEHRDDAEVILVSTDRAIRDTAGAAVRKVLSEDFAGELAEGRRPSGRPAGGKIEDALGEDTLRRLEEWRRRRA